MKEILHTLISIIRDMPKLIEEYLDDCVTNLQANSIMSVSLYDDEIWLI